MCPLAAPVQLRYESLSLMSFFAPSNSKSVAHWLQCGARNGGLLVALACFLLLSPATAQQPDSQSSRPQPPFERAQAAFMSHDFHVDGSACRAVWIGDTVSAHRRQAAIAFAAIGWRVREDTASAARVLRDAAATSW